MHRSKCRTEGSVDPGQLQFLAAISPEWEHAHRRRQSEEAEAACAYELQEFVEAITAPDCSGREPCPNGEEIPEFVDAITGRGVLYVREGEYVPGIVEK